jgi:hypothetical protein
LQKFERLLDKLIRENKIDKVDILRKLQRQAAGKDALSSNTGNILEERQSYHSNDILLDEQIMAADDEEMDSQGGDPVATDEEHIGMEA